jgi:hypothetical protein
MEVSMLKKLLLGVAFIGVASPSFAQSVPSIAVGVSNIPSNIACRTKVRSKYYEFGGTNMTESVSSNSQGSTINNLRSFVWCRETQAFIVVAGNDYTAASEIRDELLKLF